MSVFLRTPRPDIALMALYLLAGITLQWWAYFLRVIPFLNYGPPAWPNFPAYVLAGPLAAYLLWRRSPRARLATYTFLTFDILRSASLAHWLPLALDIAVILYLQTPAMRRLYPSMWSRRKRMLRMWGRK